MGHAEEFDATPAAIGADKAAERRDKRDIAISGESAENDRESEEKGSHFSKELANESDCKRESSHVRPFARHLDWGLELFAHCFLPEKFKNK